MPVPPIGQELRRVIKVCDSASLTDGVASGAGAGCRGLALAHSGPRIKKRAVHLRGHHVRKINRRQITKGASAPRSLVSIRQVTDLSDGKRGRWIAKATLGAPTGTMGMARLQEEAVNLKREIGFETRAALPNHPQERSMFCGCSGSAQDLAAGALRSVCPSPRRYRPCGSRSPIHCHTTTEPSRRCRP